MDIHQYKILILDFGSQYTQLIARRVREIGVYCEVMAFDHDFADIQAFAPSGVILSGSPESVRLDEDFRAPEGVFDLAPVLGICYGMQTMALQLGGEVGSSDEREFGHASLNIKKNCELYTDVPNLELNVWMSHGDKVTALPEGFECIASSENAPFAVMANEERKLYGVQYHPEVTHSEFGLKMLKNFVLGVCACEALWDSAHIAEQLIEDVREQVGNDHVILGLSGGVDSSVVAALLHKAIKNQLTCVFVDTGLLRLNEKDQVLKTFAEHMGVNVIAVDAEAQFLSALKGVSDPEDKRKAIGRVFVEIFQQEAAKIADAKWLAQGTIYPDVIESAGSKTGKAHVIKSHHNVGGLPDTLNLQLLEPLRELFKDEVRKLGVELGLPHKMVYRHPFPGPGLGVRILGEIKKEYIPLLQKADSIFIEILHKHDWYHKVAQAFAVFLPVKSVGVMGDGRRYDYVIAIRSVETTDFMTARYSHLPHSLLEEVAHRIVNEVPGISRVTYDITGKPPGTIEWE